MAIFIGFDASTQSVTATAIEVAGEHRSVIFERTLSYDEACPEYGTRHGVLPSSDRQIAEAPPRMWADALDRALADLVGSGIECSEIRAIAGAAQQHGTIYLAAAALEQLSRLDPERPPGEQMASWFTRDQSPIWMDSSTPAQCAEIARAVGGTGSLAQLTGSRAVERFAGPQIRKFAQEHSAAYARTARIHLVSSFLASLLAGTEAPLEPGDGSGMNLMNIKSSRWAPAALAATADGLERRLPPLRESWTVVGPLAAYWQRRYGLPAADVIAWSGDNPSTVIGSGLVHEGQVAISLGTSDTIFGLMSEPRVDPSGTGHVFATPSGQYMGLTCFRNGSLARERVRDAYGLNWAGFSQALCETTPGNQGAVMLPWFEPEITPPVHQPGLRRWNLDANDAAANVRAVVEAQAMAMRLHSRWMAVDIHTIRAVGGASANREILQVIADVFAAAVHPPSRGNAAALGAALRAWHAYDRARGVEWSWSEIAEAFVASDTREAIRPRVDGTLSAVHLERYARCEREALRGMSDAPG